MKIIQISDTHLGITDEADLVKMFKEIATLDFDVLIHCGDYNGGYQALPNVKKTVELIRTYIPSKPIVTVLGNHDFWCSRVKKGCIEHTVQDFWNDYDEICQVFESNNIHFLDESGVYIHPDFPDIIIMGHSGWYKSPNPPTNDSIHIPHMGVRGLHFESGTHVFLETRAYNNVNQQLLNIELEDHQTLIFVSHFPVIRGIEYKGRWSEFSWNAKIGDILKKNYRCRYFLNGHSHVRHEGVDGRYEAGSDYYYPAYQLLHIV